MCAFHHHLQRPPSCCELPRGPSCPITMRPRPCVHCLCDSASLYIPSASVRGARLWQIGLRLASIGVPDPTTLRLKIANHTGGPCCALIDSHRIPSPLVTIRCIAAIDTSSQCVYANVRYVGSWSSSATVLAARPVCSASSHSVTFRLCVSIDCALDVCSDTP